jgi:hypothetical protein
MKNPAWRPNLHDRQESRKKREAAELAALFCAARAARSLKCCLVIFCGTFSENFGEVVRTVPIISKQSVTADAPGNLAFLKEQK